MPRWLERAILAVALLLPITLAAPAAAQDAQPAATTRVNIYLVAIGDNGQTGTKIGCDDSLIPVAVGVESADSTKAKISAALTRLFAIHDQFYGESGLYNALYQSQLTVDSVTLENGTATVTLSGSLQVGGVCDEPRVEQQIRQTVLQFAGVDSATILLNGEALFPSQGDGVPPPPSTLERPVFQNLTPAPFSTVKPGDVRLAVIAYADSAIHSFSFKLNGTELNPEIGGPTEYLRSAFTERTLTPGVYTLTASAVDAEGDQFQAQWDFVVARNTAETEWFTTNGAPKTDQINATMRSLVESFRWHLFGLSWDGTNHPELPTHVGFKGQAAPLQNWVNGTTFDRANTEATLRSLVEAFRWHFWGQGWGNMAHCDVPTHIPDCTKFVAPDPIDPWFTSAGQPVPENISATLRSLVESFRWHFWGYSWDGSQHFEIPTHAYQD